MSAPVFLLSSQSRRVRDATLPDDDDDDDVATILPK